MAAPSSPTVQQSPSAIDCEACRSAVRSGGRQAVSVLLLDQLTIPVLGCEDHLEGFASVCGLTSENAVQLLDHRPAGGVPCPGCRVSLSTPPHPVVQVQEGAIVPLACSEHQLELVQRFQTGLRTQRELTSSLGDETGSSL